MGQYNDNINILLKKRIGYLIYFTFAYQANTFLRIFLSLFPFYQTNNNTISNPRIKLFSYQIFSSNFTSL